MAQVEKSVSFEVGVPARSSVVTLMCSAVGGGILSLPWAFQHTGYAGGLLLIGLLVAVESFTLYVLARSAEHTRTPSYPRLVRRMLGPGAGVFISVVAFAFLFGSCTAFLIVIGDSISPLLAAVAGEVWWAQRQAVIAAVGTAVVLPLCFPRSLGALAGVSSLVLYGLLVVVGAVAYRSMQQVLAPGYSWAQVHGFVPGWGFLKALPILVYGFQCHTNVITVFQEMEEDPQILTPLLTPLLSSRRTSTATTPNPSSHGGSRALTAVAAAALAEAAAAREAAVGAAAAGEGAEAGAVEVNPAVEGVEAQAGGGMEGWGLQQAEQQHRQQQKPQRQRQLARESGSSKRLQQQGEGAAVPAGPERAVGGGATAGQQQLPLPQLLQLRLEEEALDGPIYPLPPRRMRSVKLLGMMRVVYTAVGLVASFYATMGLAGYLAFPAGVQSNVLNMWPHSDQLIQVARAVIGLIQCVSYPVSHHPARAAVYEILGGRGTSFRGFRTVVTLVYFGSSLAIALTVTDLGAVFRLIGGTCGSILIFGMPGALLLNHSLRKRRAARLGLLEGQQQQQQQGLGVWGSKLWWAGLALLLLTAALCSYTVLSVALGL